MFLALVGTLARTKLLFLGDVDELLLIFPPQQDEDRIRTRSKAALANVVLLRLVALEPAVRAHVSGLAVCKLIREQACG